MGEHGTWFDYLNRFAAWRSFDALGRTTALGRSWKRPDLFDETAFDAARTCSSTLVVLAFVRVGRAARSSRGTKTPDKGIVPPRKMNLRNFFEYTAESVYGMVEGAMGESNAARFFPLIGALWLFILFGNLIGLIPGFISPNDTLKTNVGLALLVFVLTHYYGVKEHGLAYFKHFLGPSLVLAPLMLPIELDLAHRAPDVAVAPSDGQHDGRPQGRDGVLRARADPRAAAVHAARPARLPHPGPRVLHADDGLHRHGDRARRALIPSTPYTSFTHPNHASNAPRDPKEIPMNRTIKLLSSLAIAVLVIVGISRPSPSRSRSRSTDAAIVKAHGLAIELRLDRARRRPRHRPRRARWWHRSGPRRRPPPSTASPATRAPPVRSAAR